MLLTSVTTNGHFMPVWQALRVPRVLTSSFFFPSEGLFRRALGRGTNDRFLLRFVFGPAAKPPSTRKRGGAFQGDVPPT